MKENIFGSETEQMEKANDDNIEFKTGEMKFKGIFQKFIESFEAKYSLNSMFEKEPDPFKVKRIIIVFTSKKGKSKRLIIQEKEERKDE